MYEIYVDDLLIHSDITPSEAHKVLEPKLTMEDSAAGSLEFTIPPGNVGYDSIQKLISDVIVYEDGEELWRGRCISEKLNFWKSKHYVIEGALAFLNDSIQPPREFNVSNTTVRTFLETLIENHNNQVAENRQFKVGMVTVDDGDTVDDDGSIHRYTNYESTLACINEKLVNKLKGHIYIKRELDTTDNKYRFTINYVKGYLEVVDKEIRFGKNLLDYAQSYEVTDLSTVVVPRGARLDESPIEGLEAYTTVASCGNDGDWHTSGSIFVTNKSAVENYGFICAVVDWGNVTDPNNLLTKAKKYLQELQWNKLTLEVSVLDLHYLNASETSFKLLQQVRCVSEPHGMDAVFPVTKMSIDLSNPANTTFTLGTNITPTLTSASNKINTDLLNYINNTPGESAMLRSAKENARSLVMGTIDGGYASFIYGADQYGNAIVDPTTGELLNPDRPTGLRVANALTDDLATHRWIWTYGGLMHQYRADPSTPWGNTLPNAAITMDGEITADYIVAGHMSCDRLDGGSINGQVINGLGELNLYAKEGGSDGLHDSSLNWGNSWKDSLTVVTNSNSNGGMGVNRKGDPNRAIYIHYYEILWYDGSSTPEFAQFDSSPSDIRLKENIEDFDLSILEKLFKQIHPVKFDYIDGKKNQIGLIAQEMQDVFEDVGLDSSQYVKEYGDDGYYKLEYLKLCRLSMLATKDLYERLDAQQKEIDELKRAVKTLQNK